MVGVKHLTYVFEGWHQTPGVSPKRLACIQIQEEYTYTQYVCTRINTNTPLESVCGPFKPSV